MATMVMNRPVGLREIRREVTGTAVSRDSPMSNLIAGPSRTLGIPLGAT